MGNANSFSFADVECAFSGSLVLGSWFYTYCTLLMVMPALMAGILVCFYTMIWFCQHGCSKRQASEAKRHDDETGLTLRLSHRYPSGYHGVSRLPFAERGHQSRVLAEGLLSAPPFTFDLIFVPYAQ